MSKFLVDISRVEDPKVFTQVCERLQIVSACRLEETLMKVEFLGKDKQPIGPDMEEYVIRTLSSFGRVSRCH